MIKAIFFAKFDVHEGPRVIHQVPVDSIVPSPTSTTTPLIHFPTVAPFVIPRQTFCSLPLTLLHSRYRLLGHPICLTSPTYQRNQFIFNFCILLSRNADTTAYITVVTKLAALFKSLEEASHFLSEDKSPPNTGKLYALCEILLEDLNNYCEAMIPIDESNTLNIKLFPTYPPPPPVYPHHVPLSTVRLESLTDENWDLTMLLILPYINGVNSVRKIANLADADYKLVRKAVEHLLYYGCIILLDIFSFGASYGATAEIGSFVADVEMQEECRRYVLLPEPGLGGSEEGEREEREAREALDGSRLVQLYSSLKQGQSVKSWCMEHMDLVCVIDVRRFVTFGVIKGFLYRVQKYAIATGMGSGIGGKKKGGMGLGALERWLDGTHCFDEICTELGISERELVGRLRGVADIIQR